MMTPFGTDGGTHDTRTEEGSFPTTLTLDGGSSGTARKKLHTVRIIAGP